MYFLLTIICLLSFREKVYFANIYLKHILFDCFNYVHLEDFLGRFNSTYGWHIDLNPGPKPKSCKSFSVCHWNMNSISSHNFINYCLLLLSTNWHHVYLKRISIQISPSMTKTWSNQATILLELIICPMQNLGRFAYITRKPCFSNFTTLITSMNLLASKQQCRMSFTISYRLSHLANPAMNLRTSSEI